MQKENVILKKSFDFAVRIVKLRNFLTTNHKEYDLSKQILRSGTSVGANAEEANGGQSKKDFIAKMQIALKEARETHYWLRLLYATNYLEEKLFQSLIKECDEIITVITRILQTSKENEERKRMKQ